MPQNEKLLMLELLYNVHIISVEYKNASFTYRPPPPYVYTNDP